MTHDIRVSAGAPTPEELAVVIAVLNRAGGIRLFPEPSKVTKWGDPVSHMRHRLPIKNSAWRRSAWAKH